MRFTLDRTFMSHTPMSVQKLYAPSRNNQSIRMLEEGKIK
jgi:hypothetical protein